MLIGLTPARTDFFTGFMLKKNSNKLLHLFLNLVFLQKVFKVTLFYGIHPGQKPPSSIQCTVQYTPYNNTSVKYKPTAAVS